MKIPIENLFIWCHLLQGFLAPTKLDPKLLDMKHVFKENEDQKKQKIDIFNPEVRLVACMTLNQLETPISHLSLTLQ